MTVDEREEAERTLLSAARTLGSFRAIAAIAREAQRCLQTVERQNARESCKELVRAFVRSIEQHGDAETAAYLQDAVGIYQKALRDKGGKDRAKLWGPVWMALGEAARRML